MKNQFYQKRTGITIALLFFFFASFSQTSGDLINTWYEWPHETNNGNSVYKTIPYAPVPGIDHQYDVFSKLVIQNDGRIKVGQYCGYCPGKNLIETTGNITLPQQNAIIKSLVITYPDQQKNTTIQVISFAENKLVLKF